MELLLAVAFYKHIQGTVDKILVHKILGSHHNYLISICDTHACIYIDIAVILISLSDMFSVSPSVHWTFMYRFYYIVYFSTMDYSSGGPTPTKIVYEIPNPMVFLARFQIPNQDSRFQTKRFQLIPKKYAKISGNIRSLIA